MTTGVRSTGSFCWMNMLTPSPEAACAFFGEVLGWTYAVMPGMGFTVLVTGQRIGGLFDLVSPRTPPGTPPLIGVMVKVESADAAAAKATSLGGRAKAPFDVGGAGRMAVCHDPAGAELDLWEPKALLGIEVDSELHGAPSWFEVMTTDGARATAFYEGLFGWTSSTAPAAGSTYTTFRHGGVPVAGMLAVTPAMGSVASHWATYFTVADVEEAVRKAVELGATISLAQREVAGGGRIAGLVSPQGVPFRVMQSATRRV